MSRNLNEFQKQNLKKNHQKISQFLSGDKEFEYREYENEGHLYSGELWLSVEDVDIFVNVADYDIREKAKRPPSINWDHVSEDFKYLARDRNGNCWLYKERPEHRIHMWAISAPSCVGNYIASVTQFSSFDPGDCDWKESLVERPKN